MILLKKLGVGESRVVTSAVQWCQVAALNFSWPFLYGHKNFSWPFLYGLSFMAFPLWF